MKGRSKRNKPSGAASGRRMQAEQAPLRAGRHLQHIIDAIPAITYTCKATGDQATTFVSENCRRLLGYSPRQFVANPNFWISRVHPADRAAANAAYRRLLRSGRYGVEYRFRLADGSYRWMYDAMTLVRNGRGRPVEIIGHWRDIHDRKQAQQALSQSEAVARAMLDATPDRAFLLDRQGRVLACNAAAARSFGKTPRQLAGATVWGLLPRKLAAVRRARHREIFRTGKPIRAEDFRDGVWLDVNAHPIFDESGNVTGVAVFARDITEDKAAEQALKDSEQRYRSLFENSPVALWEEDFSGLKTLVDRWKRQGVTNWMDFLARRPAAARSCLKSLKVLEVNHAALRLFGAANKKDLAGMLPRLISRESYPAIAADLGCIAGGKTGCGFEATVKTASGRARHVVVRWSTEPRHQKTMDKVLISMVDITERKEAEERLQQNEERFRGLVSNIPGAVFRCRMHDRWIMEYISDAIRDISGYPAATFLPGGERYYGQIVHPDDRKAIDDAVERAIRDHRPYELEYRIIHADCGIRWVLERGRCVRGPKGEILWLDGAVFDQTERKKDHEALRALHRQLMRIREEERKRLAAEMHDSVGQDLIVMHLGLKSAFAEHQRRMDGALPVELTRAVDQCERLIGEVRAISHGLYPPTLESLGLVSALRRLASGLAPRAKAGVNAPPPLDSLRFSPAVEIALFRIAQEAAHNAIRHGHARRIDVGLAYSGGVLTLAVGDNGTGFKPAAAQGKGIGLQTMRERADAIGGTLRIQSRPGATRIEVAVPASPRDRIP